MRRASVEPADNAALAAPGVQRLRPRSRHAASSANAKPEGFMTTLFHARLSRDARGERLRCGQLPVPISRLRTMMKQWTQTGTRFATSGAASMSRQRPERAVSRRSR
jgi:hypothetical protein